MNISKIEFIFSLFLFIKLIEGLFFAINLISICNKLLIEKFVR
jgi:hypothetical protein